MISCQVIGLDEKAGSGVKFRVDVKLRHMGKPRVLSHRGIHFFECRSRETVVLLSTSKLYTMPGRISSGRPLAPKSRVRPAKRKGRSSTALNALELAEQQNPPKFKIQQHRLGEIEDDDEEPQNQAELDERSAKRRKVALHESDEEHDEGSDSDGSKWHTGVDGDDEDSDLDSDEAFGESDEERFADFTFRGSSKPHGSRDDRPVKQRIGLRKEIDLDEEAEYKVDENDEDEEDESGDSFGSDAVDLATAWDMNTSDNEKENGSTEAEQLKQKTQRDRYENDGEESDDTEDDIDEASQLSFSDGEDTEGPSKLVKFVEGLEARKDVKDSLDAGNGTKLSLATLLAASRDPSHRRALKVVQNREKTGIVSLTGGIPSKLAPPLAKRQQDRLERAAAYEKSRETLSRWIDTVKQNRRAEHISFPLQDPSNGTAASIKALALTSQSAPLTSLETTIQEIMQESGLGVRKGHTADDQEAAFEELETKTMPIEEVQARQAELRKNRELMFREEIRARRIKKIKSKSYRRVHRKERDRLAAHERELLEREGGINSEEERERNDRRRAETRMGARHKESRWAKAVKASGRAGWDEDARGGMTELARNDEELRRRMDGKKVLASDESGDETDNSDLEYEGFSEGEETRRLQDKLQQLEAQDEAQPKSKLASMAFMQRAAASKRKANDAAISAMQRTLREEAGEQDTFSDEGNASSGRATYGAQQQQNPLLTSHSKSTPRNEFEERLNEDEVEPDEAIQLAETASDGHPAGSMRGKSIQASFKTIKPPIAAAKRADSREQAMTKTRAKAAQFLDDVTSSSGSEDEMISTPGNGPSVTRQEEMVRMLFAGDDVVYDDFEAEKKDTILEEGDQVTSTSLPGWGSWTGEGISKREQRRNARNTKTVTTVKGVAHDQRKDKNLERVIINEKRIKKNGKIPGQRTAASVREPAAVREKPEAAAGAGVDDEEHLSGCNKAAGVAQARCHQANVAAYGVIRVSLRLANANLRAVPGFPFQQPLSPVPFH